MVNYINNSEFEKALKEIAESKSADQEKKLLEALVKGYENKSEEAITILEQLFKNKNSFEDTFNLQVTLLLMYHYIFNNKSVSNLYSYLTFLEENLQLSDLENANFWLAINEYLKAKRLELNNQLFESITCYNEAIKFLEKQDNKYEQQNAYYLLARAYKTYGDYDKAKECLEKCLKLISKTDEYRKATFSIFFAELLFLRMPLKNQKKALEYLETALQLLKTLNNKKGLVKTMHNFGIVYYLLGDLSKALNYFKNSYEFSDDSKTAYKVRSLLRLIELAVELSNEQEYNFYYQQLQELIEFDFMYEDELQLGKALLLRATQKFSKQMLSLKMFEKLNDKNRQIYESKFKHLLNHLDLTVVELRYARSDEAITVSKGPAQQLLDYSEEHFDLLAQTTVLINKFQVVKIEKNQEEPFNVASLKELNTAMHSIPRLSILLYIMTRKGVTDSELEQLTNLSQEKIADHVRKLFTEGFIQSYDMTINKNVVHTYMMTEKGIIEFESYAKTLTEILQGYFY